MTHTRPREVMDAPDVAVHVAPGDDIERLPAPAALAFLPLHKRAFGTAMGGAAAVVVAVLTLVHVVLAPASAPNLSLLSEYFYGYQISWAGVLVGAFWAFVAGFVAGWFVAFWRNFMIAAFVFVLRTRTELMQTRDFLDHI